MGITYIPGITVGSAANALSTRNIEVSAFSADWAVSVRTMLNCGC
jgi:hypothetical protein